ncbi:MAG TPA: hypothetical protein VHE30_11540 [Polyangiaceae bacterium]|nr:hypothetical protein [Polyangiaceae bacterium]
MAEASAERRPGQCLALGLVALGAIVAFSPSLANGFVYDDHWTIEGNRALLLPLRTLLRGLLGGNGVRLGIPDATRPAMGVSLWIDRRLFGLHPEGHHLHSLVSYAVCSVVATLALFSLSRRRSTALIGGLLFAVMPLHTEVVAAVNYREDLIAATSVFAVLSYVFWPRRGKPFVDHAVLVAAFLLWGLAGKESAIVVVPLLAVLLLGSRKGRARARSHLGALGFLGAAVGIFAAFRTFLALSGGDDVPVSLSPRGVGERLSRTAGYLDWASYRTFLPIRVTPDHPARGVPSAAHFVVLGVVVAVVVLLARRRRTRTVAAGVAIALVAPLATSPLVSPINEFADRYLFVGTLGAALTYGALASEALDLVPARARPALLIGLLPLVLACRDASRAFRSDRSLFEYAARQEPTSARAFAGLARALRLEGDLPGAERAADHAVELDPHFLRARVVRVYNRLARGDVVGARAEIAVIEQLGGARQYGLARARRCAALSPAEAVGCSRDRVPETPADR